MARKPRQDVEAGVHHVFARGVERRKIFKDDRDRRMYLKRLAAVVGRQEWRLLSYCLMPNHIHLLVETTQPNLSEGMRLLHSGYARGFNARYARDGHLFGGRFGSVRVTDDGQLWLTAAYIAANPVAAKLCERPESWPWSSHPAMAGADGAPAPPPWLDAERLLWYFGALGGEPRERYLDLINDRLAIG